MRRTEERLDGIESEMCFRMWLRKERMLKTMNIEELEALAVTGLWPDRPEPAPGVSKLDEMSREDLIKLWKEAMRQFAGRNGDELEFYANHGHWPEQHPQLHSSSDSQSSYSEDEHDYQQEG